MVNTKIFPTLTTKRLTLRQLENRDALPFFNYQKNKANFPFVDMPVYTELSQAESFIQAKNQGLKDGNYFFWAIADIETEKILGIICLWNIDKANAKGEVGYGLFPGSTGKGIMTEAVSKILEFGIQEVHLQTIEAYTSHENLRSIALLKRLNFRFSSTIKEKKTDYVIYKYSI
ncbi:MAG: GNAT family N-acetyltransferase [Promethearchaeota archaeon]